MIPSLTKRQATLLEFLEKQGSADIHAIQLYLEQMFGSLSHMTVIRDIKPLIDSKQIQKKGAGRNTVYSAQQANPLLRYIDIDRYFAKEVDERLDAKKQFDFSIFADLSGLFTQSETSQLNEWNADYRKHIEQLTPTIFAQEQERLVIEFSWKSSRIEGNTYSLIDTEILIQQQQQAQGHSAAEAAMILNHKRAFDYIIEHPQLFKIPTLRDIENVHRLLVEGLNVGHGLRNHPVGITGTRYRPLDNRYQIQEAMEHVVRVINATVDPFAKALVAMLMIAYIQPFEDGNKRTSRLLANALLLAHDICPLSLRSIDEAEYKKAIILFYEQQNARYFKQLFIEQFQFATHNYFLAHP